MWPLQKDCDAFYGDPRGGGGHANPTWEAANLTRVTPPFKIYYDGKPVQSVKVHRKCADSLGRVFAAIWKAANQDQAQIDRWGVSLFGGSYNFRLMRGSGHLSMHSYGCAIDLAPERFPMGTHAHTFVPQVIKAFADEGWVNLPNDRMHFQAARLSGLQAIPMPTPAFTPTVAKASVALSKPIPTPIKGKTTMKMPSLSNLNIPSIILATGGLAAVLPKILTEFGTVGIIAAMAMAVGFIIQAAIAPATAVAIENTVADTIIPAVEAFDPGLKPVLEQVAAGLHAVVAVLSTNTAATANNTAAVVAKAA